MKKIIIVLAVILLLPIIAFFLFYQYQTADRPFQGDLNAEVNKVRAEHNLPALQQIDELNAIAMEKCLDMVNRKYFAHINPDGKYVWEAYKYDYKGTGENLAKGYKVFTAKDHVEGWVNSSEHYKNLIETNYTQVGYAVCSDGAENDIVQILKG